MILIKIIIMEFIYAAVNSEGASVKGKVSKWRHLQTILIQLLLLGLLFFLIMQNGQLKREISSKLSHEFVEDIFNEKISQLSKDLQEIKLAIVEEAKDNMQQHQQTKKIIKLLIKEMGLPLQKSQQQKTDQNNHNNQYFELIQLIQNEVRIQRRNHQPHQQQDLKEEQQSGDSETFGEEEQVQTTYYFEDDEQQLPTCSYYQYLTEEYSQELAANNRLERKNKSQKNKGNLVFKEYVKVQRDQDSNSDPIQNPEFSKLIWLIAGVIVIGLLSVCIQMGCRKWSRVRTLVRGMWRVKTGKKHSFISSNK